MSRIGKQPILIPSTVQINLNNQKLEVSGPKGSLSASFRPEVKIKNEQNQLLVERVNDERLAKSLHGLTRTLIANMITGVTEGWTKELELVGVGYRAQVSNNNLILNIGYSHPVEIKSESGISFEVKGNNKVVVSGIDKGRVGQVAAVIRKVREPEPYKGKGIRYAGEIVRRKPGKAAKVGGGA
ncbi:MAG TPA: 50S ribosomal protein L6 [Patescibacteria group bacterium]